MTLVTGKALVLGGNGGLLGQSLVRELTARGWKVKGTPRPADNLFDSQALGELIDAVAPDVVFNTWAYTQVDKAEDEPDEARRINAGLPRMLGQAMAARKCRLVHFSTDFVFDGKASAPYIESDQPRPASVYGRTKLSGEAALLETCPAGSLTIIRTAWLFGPGKKNFVATICGLAAQRDQIKVVDDQRGSPTYTPDLAQYAVDLVESDAFGIFHVVNAGEASWFELAYMAVKAAGLQCEVLPIASSEYPQKAKRPAYSVLSTEKFQRFTGTEPRHWHKAVQEYVNGEIRST